MAVGNLHRSGATVRFADFIRPGVECELAVRLARDLPPGPARRNRPPEAVGDLVAGIEIVENRYGELSELGTPTLIADQVFHAAAVLGEPGLQDWRSRDIATLRGQLVMDGHLRRRRGRRRSDGPSAELPRLQRAYWRSPSYCRRTSDRCISAGARASRMPFYVANERPEGSCSGVITASHPEAAATRPRIPEEVLVRPE